MWLCPQTVVSAFAVYVATSLYLLFNPRILHRRRTDENKRRFRPYAHISHRGGAAESYENTIGGFRQASDWLLVTEGLQFISQHATHKRKTRSIHTIHFFKIICLLIFGNFSILFDRQYCFVNGAHINNVDIVMPRGQVATQIFMRISLSRTTSVRIQAVKGLGLRFRYCSMTSWNPMH